MKREHIFAVLFFALVTAIFYLAFLVFKPFAEAIFWGIVLAMLFFPFYKIIRRRIRNKVLSSLLMCLLIFIIIIGPFVYLGVVLVDEAVNAYRTVEQHIRSGEFQSLLDFTEHPHFISLRERIKQYVNITELNISSQILNILNRIQSFILGQIRTNVLRFSQFILNFIFVFFTMYYFFKDGEEFNRRVRGFIPLSSGQVDTIFSKLKEVLEATIYGGFVIALMQGTLGGLAFYALGISSPVFWGSLMAFLAFFPFVGAWLVYLPTIAILFLQGSTLKAFILVIWGLGVISTADNFLRPYLVAGRTQIHPLILFFAILGGLQVFGFVGIVAGPMLASTFVAFLNILQAHLDGHTVSGS